MRHSYFLEHKPPPSNRGPFHLTRYDRYVIVPFAPILLRLSLSLSLFFVSSLEDTPPKRKMVVSFSIFRGSLSSVSFLFLRLSCSFLLAVRYSGSSSIIYSYIFASEHFPRDEKSHLQFAFLVIVRYTISKLNFVTSTVGSEVKVLCHCQRVRFFC